MNNNKNMIEFLNTARGVIFRVHNPEGNDNLDFDVSGLFETKTINEIDDKKKAENIFHALNSYLDIKGLEFKKELYNRYKKIHFKIQAYLAGLIEMDHIPYEVVHDILDMFDYNDVVNTLYEKRIIRHPKVLKEKYDKTIEINDQGSREQTYTIKDYYELIGLMTILKATIGPLGFYATVAMSNYARNSMLEIILLEFYKTHPIYETPAFRKLYEYVKKLKEVAEENAEEYAKFIIESYVSKDDEAIEYVLSTVLFQKILLSDDVDAVDDKNIITRLYNAVRYKFKIQSNTSMSKTRFKNPNPGRVAEEHESESVIESFRVPTELTPGWVVEFRTVFNNIEKLARDMGVKDIELVKKLRRNLNVLQNKDIPEESIYLLGWLFKKIIDPRAVLYIELDYILNAMAVAFVWLVEHDLTDLAIIITSFTAEQDAMLFNISSKNNIDKELREKLHEYFPYDRIKNSKGETESLIELTINDFATRIFKNKLITSLPEDLIEKYKGDTNLVITPPSDIKDLLAKMILAIEEEMISYREL